MFIDQLDDEIYLFISLQVEGSGPAIFESEAVRVVTRKTTLFF
jgi:hypothetical protein